jgi:hypothetical protein
MDPDLVARSFALLCDLQNELHAALASLAGRQSQGFLDKYYNLSAGHINRAVEGFIFLRKASRIDASKFLIRPAIEAMIRLEAVKRQPKLFFRIAHTERIKDRKWIGRAAVRRAINYDLVTEEKDWNEGKARLIAQFPPGALEEKELNLRDTAKEVGAIMEDYYDSHYLMYCAYTHAALRAMTGSLNELTDPEDSATMSLCALSGLDVVASIGAATSNLESLRERRNQLYPAP